ncbi:MAG: glycine--tRNA ligase subunit beta [Fusobacteriaceae bacterium]
MRLLFEIGMEEIPARFLNIALKNLKENIEKKFLENRIGYTSVKTYGTPRRLVFVMENISEKQEDLNVLNMGPGKAVAYEENGEISRAGLGFLKSQGVEVSELEIMETPKGEYIAVRKFIEGKKTEEILPEILKTSVLELTFQKSMKWSDKKMKFARPIKWFLALLNENIVDFEIEGLKSGNKSRGHRFFGKDFQVNSIEEYFEKIRENNVIVDIDERKAMIRKTIKEKCINEFEEVLINEDLLDEVTNLVEYPYPIIGTFNSEFLEVPQEVLIISMQVHQRYFPILNKEGKLQSKFVVIRNGIEDSEYVKKGNEKVLSARLADARFFYNEDLKNNLENNIEKLKTVVYQKDLGTIYDKIIRMKKISEKLIVELKLEEKKDNIFRTVELCKTDLVSNMIGEKEFTKLQGFMGEEYALKFGENKNVAAGIREHYLPKFQGDICPKTQEGIVVALADRFDTLVGCFSVGLIPTGSKDPFALRRAALGIINIILNSNLEFSIFDIINVSLNNLEENKLLKAPKKEIYLELIEFFKQRIINVFADLGYRRDIVASVLDVENNSLIEIKLKVEALEKFKFNEDFNKFITVVKRIGNISKECEHLSFDKKLLLEEAEINLCEFTNSFEIKTDKNLKNRNYSCYISDVLSSVELIDNYFTNVMIMDKNEAIKNNRLSQMKILETLFDKMVNLKLIENI